ncbi:hypothetical protein BH24BAC1_BH24BAC1_38430 [soil metagenome]
MKRRRLFLVLPALLAFTVACQPQAPTASSPAVAPVADSPGRGAAATYSNPVFDQDFPDPTVVKGADGYYYAYATNTEVNKKTIHIQVAKSADLVNWELVGDALPQKPSWANQDFWAPHVSYDPKNQTYYLFYSGESPEAGTGKCLGVATAKNPTGPFVDKGEPLL